MTRTKKKGKRAWSHTGRNKDDDAVRTESIDMVNERFESYYKAQNLVPEDEWDAFYDALKQPLPTTFRVAGSRQVANTLNQTIKDVHVPSLSNAVFEGQNIPPPVQIPWYPEGFAWQYNVAKKSLRKSLEFQKFRSFLVFETEVGNISRQEAVSMLPPLFLDVEPHHKVMDMCAAPGSKTAQLLEALHSQDSMTATSIPSGLLIANDTDHKRTHLLIHQSARLPSPAFMVTNLDASIYPVMHTAASPGPKGEKRIKQLLFDRILCDVPCSGDGTLRKNIGIWKSWQPMDGNGLHGLQVRILQRAMKLLKPDGRIVYSTCSFNPVENEAVVVEALRTNPDFHLVDVASKLPALVRLPGCTSWRPCVDRNVNIDYATWDEFKASEHAKKNPGNKLTEGHWPPTDVEQYNLPRCLRIYPHLQDTGGFFVAVLERRSKMDANESRKRDASALEEDTIEKKKQRVEASVGAAVDPVAGVPDADVDVGAVVADSTAVQTGDGSQALSNIPVKGKRSKREKNTQEANDGGIFKEHPYTFLPPTDPVLQTCINNLSLTSAFPSSNILVRNPEGEAVRSLYIANDLVKSVIEHNNYARIRLSAAGTKVFSKQEGAKVAAGELQFRVLSEGLPVVLPFVDPRTIITADIPSLSVLLKSYYPLVSSFEEPFKSIVDARPSGSHVVKFPSGESDGTILTHDIVLPIWKSNVSLTLMMDKKAKSALSLRLFGADITIAGRDASQKRAEASKSAIRDEGDGDDERLQIVQESDLLDAMDG